MRAREIPGLRFRRRGAAKTVALALAAVALLPLAHAGYLGAKAQLAQILLERAWQAARAGDRAPPPWPWADTVPIARLRVARLGIDEIVLAGDSGRTLAFGPGWAPDSARPGSEGIALISAHRDSHFAFLRDLVQGDRVIVETPKGSTTYRVTGSSVVDARHALALAATPERRLLLATCYPFDAIVPGGPLRFVVDAIAEDDARESPRAISASPDAERSLAASSGSNEPETPLRDVP